MKSKNSYVLLCEQCKKMVGPFPAETVRDLCATCTWNNAIKAMQIALDQMSRDMKKARKSFIKKWKKVV